MFLTPAMSTQFFLPLYTINHSTSRARGLSPKERELINLLEKIPTLQYPDNYKILRTYRLQTFKSIFKNPSAFAKLQNTIKEIHLEKFKNKWSIIFDIIILRTLFQNIDLLQSYKASRLHSLRITEHTPPLNKLFKRICKAWVEAGILGKVPFPLPPILNPQDLHVLLDNGYRKVSTRDFQIELGKAENLIVPNPAQLALLEVIKQNPISTTALTKLVASLQFGQRINLPDGRMLDFQHTLYDTDIPSKNTHEMFFNLMLVIPKEITVDFGNGIRLDKLEVCVQAMRYDPGLPFSYVKTCELIDRRAILNITSEDKTTLAGDYTRKDLALRAVECELKIPEAFNMLADCLEVGEEVYISSYERSFTKKELYEESLKLDPDNDEAQRQIIYLASLTAMSQ